MATELHGELAGVFATGSLIEVEAVAARLRDLPEFGLSDRLDTLRREAEAVREALVALAARRRAFRAAADRLLRDVTENWTVADIEAATGYSFGVAETA